MSRPWSSVPNRYLALPCAYQAGGSRASDSTSVERSNGLCGATQPAKAAQKTQTNSTTAAVIATGEVRKLKPTSPSSQRCRARIIRGGFQPLTVSNRPHRFCPLLRGGQGQNRNGFTA